MLSLLTSKYSLLAAMALVAVSILGLAWWSHERHLPTPPVVDRLGPFEVASVPTGGSILVKSGILGKKTREVMLDHIGSPSPDEPFGSLSAGHLAILIGLSPQADDELPTLDPEAASTNPKIYVEVLKERRLERPDLNGEVFSESGQNLNVAQLESGLARCHPDAPEAYKAAERAAQKAKRGIWSKWREN